MHPALGIAINGLAAGLALWALALAILDREAPAVLTGAFGALELVVVSQAILAVLDLLEGHDLAEPTVSYVYLAVSVGLIPSARGTFQGEKGRWPSAALAIAGLVLIVVNLRLHDIWGGVA